MMFCSSDTNCTEEAMPVCVEPLDALPMDVTGGVMGMCVPNNASLIFELTGMTTCNNDTDCPSSMPNCVEEVNAVMGVNTCVIGCNDDDDCDDDWWCEDLPVGDMGQCVTDNQCAATGNTDDCDDDEVCVLGMCMGICEDDDDCSDGSPCEDFKQNVPFLGSVSLFSFCNVLWESTTTESPAAMSSPFPTYIPSYDPTYDPTTSTTPGANATEGGGWVRDNGTWVYYAPTSEPTVDPTVVIVDDEDSTSTTTSLDVGNGANTGTVFGVMLTVLMALLF